MTDTGASFIILDMSATSKKYFPDNFSDEFWEEFLGRILKTKNRKELLGALDFAVTPKEKNLIEKRLAIKFLLAKNVSIKEISRIVDVSTATISFVKNGFRTPVVIKKQNRPAERNESFKFKDLFSEKKKGNDRLFRKYRYTRRIK